MGRTELQMLTAEAFLVALVARVSEHEYDYAPVRVELSSRRGLGRGERVGRCNVIALDDQARF